MELPPDAIECILETSPVARLATVGPDGAPHQVPIVFARASGVLYSPVDGKPKSGRELARVRNLRERPVASLLVDHYDRDWNRLWWLRVDVRARVLEPDEPANDPECAPAVRALEVKYPQYRDWPVLREHPVLLAFDPQRTSSWCASTDALGSIS